ncbi:TonB-dependent receptor domain-containing protein [Tellurirhabdus rosea]|uniref:TonB-dependent receptor domain-containing protein n=1 Tax=Tellurirhabdus rosea TaxID=2674997 RepID=UPI0022515E77|nr:TonB-dependent receptor [Tellurirhabdus rosea]
MIKRFTALLTGLLAFCQTYAQAQITGRVFDQQTRQPIPFVSVALYRLPDSAAVAGAVTDSTGGFLISNLKNGRHVLKTFFVGFKPVAVPLSVSAGKAQDVGTLLLEADTRLLNEVRVSGQRSDIQVKADRQTYRAGQFGSAAGGTATDLVRNLPGITLNAEGELSLRGANGFLVLLNGKPVQANLTMLLNQLPANSIESVEVITTPNARFDPDGKAGIISIITKKGAESGWSATVNGLLGLPSVNSFGNDKAPSRYSGDLTLNYRAARWDVLLSSAYLRNDIAGRRIGDVSTTIGNRYTRFPSAGERSFDRFTLTNRLAVAYVPSARHSWNLGLFHSQRTEDRIADIFYQNTKTDLTTGRVIGQINYFNANLVRKRGQFFTGNLDYTHTFRNKATLSAGALYEYDFLDGFTRNLNLTRRDSRDTLQYTLSTTDRPIQNYRFNLDGSRPLGRGKLEAGYQYRNQEDLGNYRYREQDGRGQPLRLIPAFTGRITLTNRIHSVYSQYSVGGKKLEGSVGLRYETAERVLEAPGNQTYVLRLNNLFPSFNMLYKPGKGLALKAGFSRRVQRSSNFALNPLPEREHSETLEQGDPNLLPEFVNLAEVGMTKEVGRSTLIATVYYQGVENIINRVNRVYSDTIVSRIFTNAGLAQRVGLEMAGDLKLSSRWKLYVGGNLYRYTLTGDLFNNQVTFNRAAWVYSVNANTSVQLAPKLQFQANVNYLSRRITAQGEDSRFLIPNLLVKQSLMADRMTVALQWQNIGLGFLPTNEQRITTRGRNFFTTTNYIQEKDILLLNVSYSLRQVSKRAKLPGNEFGEKEF